VADLPAKDSLGRNDELLAIFSFFLLVIISTFNFKKNSSSSFVSSEYLLSERGFKQNIFFGANIFITIIYNKLPPSKLN
jgi:uncharacterized membrane protein YphA (DoxX/SURF4 family)